MKKTLLTQNGRPQDGKQSNETNSGVGTRLRRMLSGQANSEDEEIIAEEIDRLIRNVASKRGRSGLSSDDMKDICQTVLQQMQFKGIKKDRRLQALVDTSASEQEIIEQLYVHINMRISSRIIDWIRKKHRENLVPLEDQPEIESGNRKDQFPKVREVLEILQDPTFAPSASKQDRDILAEMLRSDSSAAQAAQILGLHKATAHRALARMRPILRKAFGMD